MCGVCFLKLLFHALRAACIFFLQIIVDFGYAVCDITTELSVLVTSTELPDAVTAYLLDKLSNVEYRLANGVSEKLQIGALVGAFTVARQMLTPKK
jgi:replication factor C subunit 3/5